MSLISTGFLNKAFNVFPLLNKSFLLQAPATILSVRGYAARKGTRERRAKKKVKVEVQKVGFIPHNQRNLEKFLAARPKRKFDDSWKQLPIDNVYPLKYYQWHVYSFEDAVKCHRETHHPEIYNQPNANLHVSIELNMEGEKKNRFLENFNRIASVPHKFDHGEERTIIAFTKNPEVEEAAKQAGAQLVGGIDLIKKIQNGEIALNDFQFILAEPAILAEIVVLRGLMRKRFPNIKAGTLDADLPKLVHRFLNGVNYTANKDEYEKDFGLIDTVIGTLNMDPLHLEENFKGLIQDVYSNKPKRAGSFIRRCLLYSPPSSEKLKIDYNLYINDKKEEQKKEIQQVEEEVVEKTAIAA